MSTIDLVISYYKEDLQWLNDYKHIPFRMIYIYNKGDQPITLEIPHVEIKLPNIGRCDHTYLYHIIQNYDKLAKVTIFTTGSANMLHKKAQLDFTIKKAVETNTTVMFGAPYTNGLDDMYTFQLDTWTSSSQKNRDSDPSKTQLEPAPLRPFGKWYTTYFPNHPIRFVTFGGVFGIDRDHIHSHTIKYYKELISQFPNHSNPEVGHYFERAWVSIFDPIPSKCLYDRLKQSITYGILLYLCILLLITVLLLTKTNPLKGIYRLIQSIQSIQSLRFPRLFSF